MALGADTTVRVSELMDALLWEGPGRIVLRSLAVPTPQEGEVLVRVAAVGICGSEIEGFLGRMSNRTPPLVMGHEFAGVVADDLGGHLAGRRVAVNPLISCGTCDACRRGRQNLCERRIIIGIGRPGAFAEFVSVPETNLLELPAQMSHEAGALVEPLANVVHAFELGARSDRPETVVVIGAGSIGLLMTQVARMSGATAVITLDLNIERLAKAASLGATETVAVGDEGVERRVIRMVGGGADLVVDCVGARSTKRLALRLVRAGGRIVFVGLHDDETPLSSHDLIRREVNLIGSFTYTPEDMRRALEYLSDGSVRFDSWAVTRPLREGANAFEELVKTPGRYAKVILEP